jgi:molybdopterin-containing oxidoreductase family membrane subunit
MVILVIVGLSLMYFSALPDIAAVRDRAQTPWYQRLALSWRGTRFQWRILFTGLGILGGFYFMMIIFTHAIFSMDLGESLIPGLKDSIFPTAQALHAIQSAVALVLVTMYVMRRWGGYHAYLGVDQFWGLSKLLLAASLLWFYFWFAGMITFWYGRQPIEQITLKLLMFESYLLPFLLAFFMCFIIPVALLIWNRVRKNIAMLAIIAGVVLIGNFFETLRIYVAAFSIEDVTSHALEQVPAAQLPNVVDLMVIVGGLAGAVLVYLLAARVIPIISIWEMRELLLLRRVRSFVRLRVVSLGKPE